MPPTTITVLRACWRQLCETARLAVGVPDYGSYLRHQRERHPDAEPLSYEAFFADRLAARYARGRSRCC
ncbi:MAG: YbdD/YjiX family protein [Rhodanobacteraceae bacterium]|nr:YbdD/YjiX family protein [Rhodanobacteraceae bacterium]